MATSKKYNKIIECIYDVFYEYIKNFQYITYGKNIGIILDDDRRATVTFWDSYSDYKFTTLNMKIVSKTKGDINKVNIPFREIFDVSENKYIKLIDGYYQWVSTPTEYDFERLRDMLRNYVNIWR